MAKRTRSGARAPAREGRGRAGQLLLYPLVAAAGLALGVAAHRLDRGRALSEPPAAAFRAPAPGSAPRARAAEDAMPAARASKPALPEIGRPPGQPPAPEASFPSRGARPRREAVAPLPPIEVSRGAGQRPEVALTFDAGAAAAPTVRILRALAEAGAPATFFLTGEWARRYPDLTRAIAAAGHEIGNHSWSHPDFTRLTDAQIRDELARTEALLQATTGRSSRPYFRPPFGARDARVRQLVGQEGYLTVYWSLDSHDAVDPGLGPEEIRERVLRGVVAGSIVLLHCGSQATAEALPEILDGLRARGLAPVTLRRLLEE